MNSKDFSTLEMFPRRHWVAIGVTCLFVAALLILIPVQHELERRTYAYELPVPEKTESSELIETPWDIVNIRSGDTLAQLFQKQGLSSQTLYALTQAEHGKSLNQIRPGNKIGFVIENQELQQFKLETSLFERFVFRLDNNQFVSEHVVIHPDVSETFTQGTIDSSLFEAGLQAGLSNQVIMQLAFIFGWDVDFVLDIRQGDTFSLIYQEKYLDGEKVGDGDILIARFENQGNVYTAVRYEDDSGYSQYFTPKGMSMRKEFLRSPVDFTRISSHFNLKRKHPVLHKIRAHRGVDYAARRGTPIKAAGDGKVIHAARKGGFGNAVILQHGTRYTTLYAHLDKFGRGIRRGKTVRQGQIIGYVGSTGLASGPHLHYEFRVNGVHRNPVTVKLPHAEPIKPEQKERFLHYAHVMVMRLESHMFGDFFAAR